MKTTEKLFSRYWDSGKVGEILCMSKPNFIKALAEHDAEIISKIKEIASYKTADEVIIEVLNILEKK